MSNTPDPRCAGFAVAGGRSQRMGRDKAVLAWAEATLLDHTVARLAEVAAEVVLLPGDEPRYQALGLRSVLDETPGLGPLGAVASGLADSSRPLGLFLGVDLPFVPAALLRGLVSQAAGWQAVVPVSAAGPEPLCAVYGRSCLGPIRDRLAAGERKMTCFWPDVRVREVAADELSAFGDPQELFRNLNTPQEYHDAARDLKSE